MSISADRIISLRTSKTIYRSGELVIKLFSSRYPSSFVFAEAHRQSLAADRGILAPVVRKVERTELSSWAIYSDYIPGDTLWQKMCADGYSDRLTERFITVQLSLHSREMTELPSLYDVTSKHLTDAPISAVKRYELQNVLENFPEYKKICHLDFAPWNIIVSDLASYGLSGSAGDYILDWPLACYGNPYADAAQTYIILSLNGMDELAERYLVRYAERSGAYLRQLKRWIPIMAAARLGSDCCADGGFSAYREHSELLLHFANLDYGKI